MKNVYILPTDKLIKNVGDLVKDQYGDIHIFTKNDGKEYGKTTTKFNIYITSDEEIKEGDWVIQINYEKTNINLIKCVTEAQTKMANDKNGSFTKNKIILTTDQDLIKNRVQVIDDEFLEWFVKNPSCEEVEVNYDSFEKTGTISVWEYEIIIPKEGLSYTTKMGITISDEMVRAVMIPKEYFGKEEPKQISLVERMKPLQEQWQKDMEAHLKQETLEEAIERLFIHYPESSGYRKAALIGKEWQQERSYSEEEVLKLLKSRTLNLYLNIPTGKYLGTEKWFEQFKKK